MHIRRISKVVLVSLWLLTLAAAFIWAFVTNPPFDPEPVTVLLGLISTAITAVLNEYSARLQKEEFSTSYALAYGYVNNFLEPVLTKILSTHSGPRFVIYVPERLSELEPSSIERLLARMREKKMTSETIGIEISAGKVREILTITKSDAESVYFDFPTTLLTLKSYIEYKLETARDTLPGGEMERLGRVYIDKFKEALAQMIRSKGLEEYVSFTNQGLQF